METSAAGRRRRGTKRASEPLENEAAYVAGPDGAYPIDEMRKRFDIGNDVGVISARRRDYDATKESGIAWHVRHMNQQIAEEEREMKKNHQRRDAAAAAAEEQQQQQPQAAIAIRSAAMDDDDDMDLDGSPEDTQSARR